MTIQRYHTFTREGSSVIERADDGEFVFHSAHADKLTAMQARAEKAEAAAAGKFTLEEIETAFFSHNHGGDEGGEGEYLHRKNTWKSFCRFLDLRIEPSLEKASTPLKGTQ